MSTTQPSIGVFLIHGFLGSPLEWRKLEKLLQAKGFGTGTTFQLGHDTTAEMKLIDCKAEAILEHCWNEYTAFAKAFRPHLYYRTLTGWAYSTLDSRAKL
jgi:esterase/lipase